MAFFDLPLAELHDYSPEVRVPDDFDEFWTRTIGEVSDKPLRLSSRRVDTGLVLVDSYDVTFAGFGGAPIRAWLTVPRDAREPLGAVVEYHGYDGGRGLPFENTIYAMAGYAHIVMDVRGQGRWRVNDTPDPSPASGTGPVAGFMTRGILDPLDYYYRRVYIDAARAIAAARQLPLVDPGRIVVAGASQGGGIALAAAALDGAVAGALIDVPFLCHFERAIALTDQPPYREITDYLSRYRDREDRVTRTLSYFDAVNFASRTQVPALYSAALMDRTCPPSTVFAAYNAHGGPRDISVYRFNDHEGGAEHHQAEKLRWLAVL